MEIIGPIISATLSQTSNLHQMRLRTINPYAVPENCQPLRRTPLSQEFSFAYPHFKRDFDVLTTQCLALRRLDRKAQMFPVKVGIGSPNIGVNEMTTNRLIHVLTVCSIAETLCLPQNLNLNGFLAKSGAIVHDVSHTPWAHPGERSLDKVSMKYLGRHYLHSIGGVYLLDRIEGLGPQRQPFNLDMRVLEAIAFHDGEAPSGGFWRPSRKRTWGDFEADCSTKETNPKTILVPSTLEGLVVRFSDKIAFLPDDIETCIHLRLFGRKEIPQTMLGIYGPDIRQSLISDLIKTSKGKDYIAHSDEAARAINIIQDFFIEKVFKGYNGKIQDKLDELFETMFTILLQHLKEGNSDSPIAHYKNYMAIGNWEKLWDEEKVLYFIAGMTEEYFRDVFKMITAGTGQANLLRSLSDNRNKLNINRLTIGLENLPQGLDPR